MSDLAGKRILIVEDEALLAVMVADILEGQEAIFVGPAATVRKALILAEDGCIDIALLDVNLRGENIVPIAHLLYTRGTPIVFVTGYGKSPTGPWIDAPVIGKPFTEADLLGAIQQAFKTNRDVVID